MFNRLKMRLLALLPLFLVLHLSAQQKPEPVYTGPDAPEWMQKMLSDNPNVLEIQQAYKDYYEVHPFEKNSYTQFYKRWMHWARPLTQGDGTIHEPTVDEMNAAEKQRLFLRAQEAQQQRGSAAGWTFVGPKQTFDTDGQTVVTWQTNIYSIAVAPSDPNVVYAGGESGGIWKTTDKGMNWTLLSAGITHGAFSAIAVHPNDPNTVYAGTGGKIIKSTNGGATWTNAYTENSLWTNELAIKPDQPDVVLAATDQGLVRTANGGATWTKIHVQQTWTVKFKPGTPSTVFTVRKSGSGSDFRVSTDAGATFTNSNTGWWTPGTGQSVTGAIIAVCPSNPSKVYVYICGEGGNLGGYVGVFRSLNDGANWTNTHPSNSIGQPYSIPNHTNLMDANGVDWFTQGFYDMAIVVNPNNDNQLIAGGCSWFKSNNSGQTWEPLGGYVGGLSWSHPDIQALAAIGNDLWITSDGGVNYSPDFGASMDARMNGISGSDNWGFDAGWNEDVLVGGRYHNGNMAWHESFPEGKFYRMGGAEAATGYLNPGDARKTYHSDIGGYRLKGGFKDGVTYFPVGLFPNESYAYYANSEMVWDPRCWNIVYLGNGNKIWKSYDGGTSFAALYTFPGNSDNSVFDIEVSRSNPEVIYCSQWDGTDDAMWRSNNGGKTWTQLTKLPLPNNNDRVKMALSAEDEDMLWVSVSYGSNGKKIYKTTDGGVTWVNLTTPILNNIRITSILAQYGTDGGVYLGTNAGVFYRNNSMSDWQPYSTDLPLSAETNRLKPFYRDGKIRNGTWGFGVWEAPLYEPSQVIVQPMASALETGCSRDTVYFDDYSVLNHDGATWDWAFSPAPRWASDTHVRNPKVVFGESGIYTATLTVNGSYSGSLTIRVNDACRADTIPGSAVTLGGNSSEDYVALPPLNITTNTITVTAWIKPDGIQPDYSSIFMHDGATAGFNFLPGSNQIGYHWPNGAWWWNSGLTAPAGQWSHVAMVADPTGITIYVNGKGAKHSFTVPAVNFDSGNRLGNYKGWGGRFVKGTIDEVCVYNRSLTQAEIRELMHLTKDPAQFPELISYYQFNEPGGPALDKVGIRHGALVGPSIKRERSTAPVGKGVSYRASVVAGKKRYGFGATGLTLLFPSQGSYPNGELVVSRLSVSPDTVPNVSASQFSDYWILHNFGSNGTFVAPAEVRFSQTGGLPADIGNSCKLWRRDPLAHGPLWQSLDNSDEVIPGLQSEVAFTTGNQVTQAGQFWLEVPGAARNAIQTRSGEQTINFEFRVFPNPAPSRGSLQLTSDSQEPCVFRLFNEKGQQVRKTEFLAAGTLQLSDLPAGVYAYRVENGQFMRFGKLVVE